LSEGKVGPPRRAPCSVYTEHVSFYPSAFLSLIKPSVTLSLSEASCAGYAANRSAWW